MYPNPASTFVKIDSGNQPFTDHLDILNFTGAIVKTIECSNDTPLDISELPDGIYFFRFTKNRSTVYKLIVQ
ncbi:MAG: T9SS type A sorting domain-containing protein [Bacteroidetes bacterium]|nr:T9SS type A sorting domain-containing protein [Bacteroidota bacterium]